MRLHGSARSESRLDADQLGGDLPQYEVQSGFDALEKAEPDNTTGTNPPATAAAAAANVDGGAETSISTAASVAGGGGADDSSSSEEDAPIASLRAK